MQYLISRVVDRLYSPQQQQVHISPAVFEPQHTQKHSRAEHARTYIYLLLLLPLELPLRPRTTNRPTDDLCATQCSGATKYTAAASVIAKKKQNRKASSSALSHGGRLLHGLQGRHDWPFLFPKEPPSVCSIYIYSSSEWGDEKLGGRRRSGSGLLDATDKRRKKCEATILYNYIVLCIYPLGLLYFFCSQTSKKAQVVQLFRELPSASKEESSSIVNTNISKQVQVHRSYLFIKIGMSYQHTQVP